MIPRIPSHLAAALLASGITLAWTTAASATECKSDADCPSGYQCEKGVSMPGCAPGQDCSDAGPIESETGSCEKAPIACQTDADCPAYLKCTSSGDTVCWQDSTGDGGCEEPDPNAPKYCQYEPITCDSDAACPEGFACTEVSACPSIDCVPGSECPEPTCQTSKYCAPKEIVCAADTDCPAEWTCMTMTEDCATTPTEPEPDLPGEPDSPAPADQPSDSDCQPTTRSLCVPPGFSGVGEYEKAVAEDSQSGAQNAAASGGGDSDDSGVGCSLVTVPAGSALASGWLAVAIALLAGRRRAVR